MNMYVVRHGQTDWNKEGKVQGRADIALNAEGIRQAYITKELLENESIDLILCSPLLRARQTAEIIKGDREILLITEQGLIERDFGEFEGLTPNDFDFGSFCDINNLAKYEKAENAKEFFGRVNDSLRKIRKDYKDYRNILIVTHAGVSVAIECFFTGLIYKDSKKIGSYALKNGEVKKYEYR